jgi:hypothetical protein
MNENTIVHAFIKDLDKFIDKNSEHNKISKFNVKDAFTIKHDKYIIDKTKLYKLLTQFDNKIDNIFNKLNIIFVDDDSVDDDSVDQDHVDQDHVDDDSLDQDHVVDVNQDHVDD